jgi:dihydrodipicolinate synthase/N-acetylneuraminate lyase
MYGGAGCPEELCKSLVDNGVVLLSVYGSTGNYSVLSLFICLFQL